MRPGHKPELWRGIGVFFLAAGVAAWVVWDSGWRLYHGWRTHGSEPRLAQPASTIAESPGASGYSVSRIIDAHLFGQVDQGIRDEVAHVPETKLQVNLLGLIASADRHFARAFIDVNGSRAKSYSIGEQIDQTDAALEAVESNRVLLKRGNAVESLALKRPDYSRNGRQFPAADGGEPPPLPEPVVEENDGNARDETAPDPGQNTGDNTILQGGRSIELRKPF